MCKLKNIIFLGFMILAIAGCQTYTTVLIEVVKPAKIVLPTTITDISVLNASMLGNSSDIINLRQKYFYLTDSVVTQLLVNSVASYINESPRFNSGKSHKQLYHKNIAQLRQYIASEHIESICYQDTTNSVLALEGFGINDTLIKITTFDGYNYSSYYKVALICSSAWRLYGNDFRPVANINILRDTLFLNEIETVSSYRESLKDERFRNWVAEMVSYELAEKISRKFAPYWIQVQRDFFNGGNEEMEKAATLAKANKWIPAATIWQKNIDNENKKIAASACYNMALASEVQGRLDLSQVWLEKSQTLYPYSIALNYLKVVKYRLNEQEVLDKQFGKEETNP